MTLSPTTLVADVAAAHPSTTRVFQSHGIDFCCGGRRPLAEACAERGLPFEALRADLQAAIDVAPGGEISWQALPLAELVEHVVARYHVWLRRELPRLSALMAKVVDAHGARHPSLSSVAQTLRALTADLEPHMLKEERILFPFIVRLEAAVALGGVPDESCFGSVANPIRAMESEHEGVRSLLLGLRAQTQDFSVPADGCNSWRALCAGLAELESELHEHIHVENNVLHPRALRLEQRLTAVG